MREMLERVAFAVAAFVVALLPERVKGREPWRSYSSSAAHICSGVAETAIAVLLFGAGFLAFVGEFSSTFGLTFITNIPNPTTSDAPRMGILGFVSYLVTPWAMASFFCVVEGVLRALDAALSGRHLGMAFLSLPHWLWLQLRERTRRADLALALGPARPDRIEHPDRSPDGCLRITSRDDKPWSDVQVVEFEERFYLLVEKTMVPDGGFWSYRYRLRPMEPSEVIRGRIVRYEPAAAPPPPPPPPAPAGTGGPGGDGELTAKVLRRPPQP